MVKLKEKPLVKLEKEYKNHKLVVIYHDFTKYPSYFDIPNYYCGYVSIPEDHFLFGQDLNEKNIEMLNVHGGVTFADYSFWEDYSTEGKRDWWLGFDCDHDVDISNPKDLIFVERECEKLINQLVALKKKGDKND